MLRDDAIRMGLIVPKRDDIKRMDLKSADLKKLKALNKEKTKVEPQTKIIK